MTNNKDEYPDSFSIPLHRDVEAASELLGSNDTPFARRTFVRTVFSAIEGLIILAKLGLRSLPLSPGEHTVLFERSYDVDSRGKITSRAKHVPLDKNIKAVVRILARRRPDYSMDYNHPGWTSLLNGLKVRHRLAHPKTKNDLAVSDEDLGNVHSGFLWIQVFVIETMEQGAEAMHTEFGDNLPHGFIETARKGKKKDC